MNTLECDGIQLAFGLRKILTSIHIKCETGQIVGLLGRNGSGKSCLMQVITGALDAESKSIRINDRALLRPFSTNNLSYLPQHHFIPSILSIQQALKMYGVSPLYVEEHFPELLPELRKTPPQLSGGTLRIMEVLLVAALPVKFVLLDEPFSGIMPVYVERLKLFLTELKKQKGILITDHLFRHVTELTDAVYVLTNGQTYRTKTPEDLIRYGYLHSL